MRVGAGDRREGGAGRGWRLVDACTSMRKEGGGGRLSFVLLKEVACLDHKDIACLDCSAVGKCKQEENGT